MIINDKKEFASWLDTCDELKELRQCEQENGDLNEWPEFRKEIVKLCFSKTYLRDALGIKPPPALGQDWGSWLKKNLAEIEEEAIGIVM